VATGDSSHNIILAHNIKSSGRTIALAKEHPPMELKQWLSTLSAALGTNDVTMDDTTVRTLLDLARDSAHEVERVAAPLTTYLVGIAVGRGATLSTVATTATALLMNEDAAD
jgi:hypothetical protein